MIRECASNLRVVLVGGTSHVGKSTLAESLAAELGWSRISTDSLARHPGRPWRQQPETVPDHVADHYLSLSVDELLSDVLRHYRVNVWPKVEEIIASYANDTSSTGVVIEGSAVWPEFVVGLNPDSVTALWLTASRDVLTQRIYGESLYHSKTGSEPGSFDFPQIKPSTFVVSLSNHERAALRQAQGERHRTYNRKTLGSERMMIDKFLNRTLAYDAMMVEVAGRHGLTVIDVLQSSPEELMDRCLSVLNVDQLQN